MYKARVRTNYPCSREDDFFFDIAMLTPTDPPYLPCHVCIDNADPYRDRYKDGRQVRGGRPVLWMDIRGDGLTYIPIIIPSREGAYIPKSVWNGNLVKRKSPPHFAEVKQFIYDYYDILKNRWNGIMLADNTAIYTIRWRYGNLRRKEKLRRILRKLRNSRPAK